MIDIKFMVIVFVSALFIISVAEATTFYKFKTEGSNIRLNTTLVLDNEDPINVWEVVWSLPENSSLISIHDDVGEIKNYNLNQNKLTFSTNFRRSNVRYVYIDSVIEKAVNDNFKPVYSIELSLSGLAGKKTFVETDIADVLSGYSSFGFAEFYGDNLTTFQGIGPVNIKLFFSPNGQKYDNFIVFGDYDATLADKLYSIVSNVTGVRLPFKQFPLLILPDQEFDQKINSWAAATHIPGGLIIIRESAVRRDTNVSIILHELTHGYNAKILSWDQSQIVWFDEGMGKFVEHLVDDLLNVPQPSLFGNDVPISQNGKNYLLLPKGDIKDLWNYYQNNQDFMKVWNTKDPDKREFGYAYSELVIREFVQNNGIDSLKGAYQKLASVDHVVIDSQEHNTIYFTAMNLSFKPCSSDDYEDFVKCINSIDQQEIVVSGFSGEFVEPKKIVINETLADETSSDQNETMKKSLIQKILFNLENLILSTIRAISNLFS